MNNNNNFVFGGNTNPNNNDFSFNPRGEQQNQFQNFNNNNQMGFNNQPQPTFNPQFQTNSTINTQGGNFNNDDFNPRSNNQNFNNNNQMGFNNNSNPMTQPTFNNNSNPMTQPTFNNFNNNSNPMTQPTFDNNIQFNNNSNPSSQPTFNNFNNNSNPMTQPTFNNNSNPMTQPTFDNNIQFNNNSNPSTQPTFTFTPQNTQNAPLPNNLNELKEILRQERLKNTQIFQEKSDQITKWSQNYTQLKEKNQSLQQKIQEAKEENSRLKNEYSLLVSNNESEMKLLCNIQMNEILQKFEKELEKFHGSSDGNTLSSVEDLEKRSDSLSKVLRRLEEATKSNLNDIILSELDDLVDEIGNFLDCAKGLAKSSNSRYSNELLQIANKLANSDLFKQVLMDPTDTQKSNLLIQNMRSILNQDLKSIISEFKKSDNDKGLELQDLADKELLSAAERIRNAAQKIANAKQNLSISFKNTMTKSQIEVCEHLLGSTEKIAIITGQLVHHASLAQKERTSGENIGGQGQVYRKNAIWVNGLISCVHSVADRINTLVETSNKVVSGETSWEFIVAASEEVQMFGVQLVTASRAKLPLTSENRRNLENTQTLLNIASKELINAAKTYKVHNTPEIQRKRLDQLNSIQIQTQIHNQLHSIEENKNKLLEAEKSLQKMLASHDIFEDDENKPNLLVTLQDRAKTMMMMANTAKEFSGILKQKVMENSNKN